MKKVLFVGVLVLALGLVTVLGGGEGGWSIFAGGGEGGWSILAGGGEGGW